MAQIAAARRDAARAKSDGADSCNHRTFLRCVVGVCGARTAHLLHVACGSVGAHAQSHALGVACAVLVARRRVAHRSVGGSCGGILVFVLRSGDVALRHYGQNWRATVVAYSPHHAGRCHVRSRTAHDWTLSAGVVGRPDCQRHRDSTDYADRGATHVNLAHSADGCITFRSASIDSVARDVLAVADEFVFTGVGAACAALVGSGARVTWLRNDARAPRRQARLGAPCTGCDVVCANVYRDTGVAGGR